MKFIFESGRAFYPASFSSGKNTKMSINRGAGSLSELRICISWSVSIV
jgi:hypothetical protein